MYLIILVMLMYEVNDGMLLFMSLLSMCKVMILHIYIALLDLDWGYE